MSEPQQNDRNAALALSPRVYDELRGVAESYLRRQPPGFTLRPTELVHEALLHLLRHEDARFTSTGHFRAIATRKIWQVVVDHLRHRCAQKRGGAAPGGGASPATRPRRVPLEQVTVEWQANPVDLLDLADALELLRQQSQRLHDVIMLHWFGHFTHEEVGAELGISKSTAEKDFRYALAWLSRRFAEKQADEH